MKKLQALGLMLFAFATSTFAQDSTKKIGIELYGFVRSDAIVDTRQSETIREGGIMMYPKAPDYDAQGRDVNERVFTTFYVLHTRLAGKISGPDVFGAKARALFEGEFFGLADTDVNGYRVRHAFVELDWGKTQLLFGQFWHPMFQLETVPTQNFAAPFVAYSRNPQFRLTHRMGDVQFLAAALMQTDFKSFGPDPATGKPVRNAVFIRNAGIPEIDAQVSLALGKGSVIGVGGSMKSLLPKLKNELGATGNAITSFNGLVFGKFNLDLVTFRFHAMYGQNLADLTVIGGYAVKSADTTAYTNINSLSVWGELSTGKDITVGLFFGYVKNLGTDDPALRNMNKIYAMGANVDNVLRVSPFLHVNTGRMRFFLETEYTGASYGSFKDDHLLMDNFVKVSNVRTDLGVFYYF
jgi:hypothetical protein